MKTIVKAAAGALLAGGLSVAATAPAHAASACPGVRQGGRRAPWPR